MKKKVVLGLLAISLGMGMPLVTQAESLDTLNQKEASIQQESQQISHDLEQALTAINEKYQAVSEVKKKVLANETILKKTKTQVQQTQADLEQRKKIVAQRLQSIQLNGANQTVLTALLDARDFNELLHRTFTMSMLQQSEQDKIKDLSDEQTKLTNLAKKQEQTQTELKKNEEQLQKESDSLNDQLTQLKEQLQAKQADLQKISEDKEVEQARLEAEKARQEQAEKEAKQAEEAAREKAAKTVESSSAAKDSSTMASSTAPAAETATSSTAKATPALPTVATPITRGKTMQMQSTAYSCAESVNTFWTAMGIDLRQNPMVVAVDPNVIPLGSMVEVSGYGIAIAGDTGGAIKGNIVDVHFPTVEQCIQWGRRNVTVTIIEQ
ncbi:3D domain-containing protein [Enterococcus sp. CSURQ0835]|uniref:3D domain-containing protein n=1 Tax=Enterococcus sp. CSURQ0835 TaxID=2681394 RepID=UPI00135B043E|nr:3D domain-containing protein [Enterococcus sp. CSURQ0835]